MQHPCAGTTIHVSATLRRRIQQAPVTQQIQKKNFSILFMIIN